MSYEAAVRQITAKSKTDKEKARAIFDFLAFNIRYNTAKISNETVYVASGGLDAYYAGIAKTTWNDRNGVCEGYGRLYVELCKAAGLNCEYISGYNKKFEHTYGRANGNHGWNVVHIGNEHILLDSCWGAGDTNGDNFTFRFKDFWFDVDPYTMIFSHYPKEERHQYLTPAISKDVFDALPRIDPTISVAGITGRELYEFFVTHPRAWMFTEYGGFFDGVKSGVRFNKIQFAKSLKKNTEYVVNVSYSSSPDVWIAYDNVREKLPNGKDYKFTPKTNSAVKIFLGTGSTMLMYNVEDNPKWEWETASRKANAKLLIPSIVR